MNMRYVSDTAQNRIHNLFRLKCVPIPLGHSVGTISDWKPEYTNQSGCELMHLCTGMYTYVWRVRNLVRQF